MSEGSRTQRSNIAQISLNPLDITPMDPLCVSNDVTMEDGSTLVNKWKERLASMSLEQKVGFEGITKIIDRYSRVCLLSKVPQLSLAQKVSYEREMRELATTIKVVTKMNGLETLLSASIGPSPGVEPYHENPLSSALRGPPPISNIGGVTTQQQPPQLPNDGPPIQHVSSHVWR